jgi:hypothetical protein
MPRPPWLSQLRITSLVLALAGLLAGVPVAADDGADAGVASEAAAEVASQAEAAADGDPAAVGPPETEAADEVAAPGTCNARSADGTAFVDRFQRGLYRGVCGTALWFDGLFGAPSFDQGTSETFGRFSVYEFWDDRDGLETKVRLRARVDLPAAKNRLRLLFGRVDDRELVEDREPQIGESLPSGFEQVEDESWLLGLGYSPQKGLVNGFDFGAGIRIRSPVDPYVKGSYTHTFDLNESSLIRLRQTVFWRDSRGLGETTDIEYDYLLTPRLLFRFDNAATLAEDVDRLEWSSALRLFQSLGERRALVYTGFITGVAQTEVPIRNYGVELRYRRPAFREWLFLELRSSVTWPRGELDTERKINPGVGIGFEMYFGPVPDRDLR